MKEQKTNKKKEKSFFFYAKIKNIQSEITEIKTQEENKEKEKSKKTRKVTKSAIIANPQTGDNVISYVVTLTASMGSLIGSTVYTTRKEY